MRKLFAVASIACLLLTPILSAQGQEKPKEGQKTEKKADSKKSAEKKGEAEKPAPKK
jgi:hypothetical protein